MHIAGIDAHTTYVVVGIVDNTGALVQKPLRIRNADRDRLVELLERHAPVEIVVEASPAWPWLYDLLDGVVARFVLAHPKKLCARRGEPVPRAPDRCRGAADRTLRHADPPGQLFGLAPSSARSGMKVRYGPIPAGANRWLRNASVQTALVHRQRAPESWPSRYHDELKQRVDWRVARVATARKLARAVHAMLRTGEAMLEQTRAIATPA